MRTQWRALVINGTFLEVLDEHQAYMERNGLLVIPIARDRVTAESVYDLGQNADVIFGPGPGLNAAFFAEAPRLKVVAIAASGYDSVDLPAATRAGVVVTNAPTPAGSEAVADMAFGLMLAAARDIPQRHWQLITEKTANRRMGSAVWGKTMGVVGLGRIGQAMVPRAKGFGMHVLGYNRSWRQEHERLSQQHSVQRVDLNTLLQESDFVSLHLRGTPETANLIGAFELSLMKSTAYLINTARASLVDTVALHKALQDGQIAGAALDTIVDGGFDTPLLGMPNVVGTPHLGNRCVDSVHDVMRAAMDDALAVLHGERPRYPVNHDMPADAHNSHRKRRNQ